MSASKFGWLITQARYFTDEVKDKNGTDIDVRSWQQEYVEDLPEQENGFVLCFFGMCSTVVINHCLFFVKLVSNKDAHRPSCLLNRFDCGMFMIKYADFYSRGLSLCFNQVRFCFLIISLFSIFSNQNHFLSVVF